MNLTPVNPRALAVEADHKRERFMRGWFVCTWILTGYALYLFFTV